MPAAFWLSSGVTSEVNDIYMNPSAAFIISVVSATSLSSSSCGGPDKPDGEPPALSVGVGDGGAPSVGAGVGEADGEVDALSEGEGFGGALPAGDGDGCCEALSDGEGAGDALSDGDAGVSDGDGVSLSAGGGVPLSLFAGDADGAASLSDGDGGGALPMLPSPLLPPPAHAARTPAMIIARTIQAILWVFIKNHPSLST